MPKREDEYWAGTKEPKGRGLCPFCGSPNVFYSKHYERWTCGNCEKSFPSPSYGPGGDFGKEARWFGKTTAKMRRREFAEARAARQKKSGSKASNTGYPFDPDHVGYYKGEYRGRRIKVGGFTARKAFLIFLLIACLAAAVWAGYLLFTNRTDPVIGTIIFVADIGVLIWNISVLRKWSVGTGTIVAIAVVIALLGGTIGAFAGIKPFSTVKNGLVTGCPLAPSQPPEQLVPSTEQQPPPASTYPADISGHVTITDKVIAKYNRNKPDTWELTPLEGQIYWIVDISVKNKAYEDAVTASYNDWKIVAGDKVYDSQKPFMDIWPSTDMNVPVGGTGETTIRFPVPNTLNVSNAKLCYQGQAPYSYGKLTGGDKVAAYDWDSKTVIPEPEEKGELYVVCSAKTSTKRLRTVAQWSGTEDKVIPFRIDKSPWVINGSYERVSEMGYVFEYYVVTEEAYKTYSGCEGAMWYMLLYGRTSYCSTPEGKHCLVGQSGDFFICVSASGVEWELKVGVE